MLSCQKDVFGTKQGSNFLVKPYRVHICYEFLEKYLPKKSNLVVSQPDQHFVTLPHFIISMTNVHTLQEDH